MSSEAETALLVAPDRQGTPIDLRIRQRYPIALPVQYKWSYRRGRGEYGTGTTINISSRGILFRGTQPPPLKSVVELALTWPVSLDDRALKLVMRGRVVRTAGDTAAVRVAQYEFRLTGSAYSGLLLA
ncbi:MAG TPA: PilZ domain-containing protein [Bryobacteraceae bacterium]